MENKSSSARFKSFEDRMNGYFCYARFYYYRFTNVNASPLI